MFSITKDEHYVYFNIPGNLKVKISKIDLLMDRIRDMLDKINLSVENYIMFEHTMDEGYVGTTFVIGINDSKCYIWSSMIISHKEKHITDPDCYRLLCSMKFDIDSQIMAEQLKNIF